MIHPRRDLFSTFPLGHYNAYKVGGRCYRKDKFTGNSLNHFLLMHFPSFLKAQGGSSSHHIGEEEISTQKWCSSQPTYLNGLPYIGGLSSQLMLRKALKVKTGRCRGIAYSKILTKASLVVQMVKNLPTMQETQVRSLCREDPWRRKWQLTSAFLPGEFHRQKSLVGYSPRDHTELDMTE